VPDWTLRLAGADDTAFLLRVYASTRRDELAGTGWGEAQVQTFLEMQFRAQDRYYREQFPDGRFEIVEVDGCRVGRLCTDRSGEAIHLIDIALLSEHRCGGLGGAIVRSLLAEAAAAAIPVSLHVELHNPARRLYERLGFVATELHGIHQQMHWLPPALRDDARPRSTPHHQELIHDQST
jgi:ribosomal protein S18 acetylase RimI-like enzyme